MSHPEPEDHGPGLLLARSDMGAISVCGCGVLTLTLQYLSLRFEPGAFRELQALLSVAQRRLDGDPAMGIAPASASSDAPAVH
ncbi:hypothetical protein [Sphaerotilus sp.]|uniref:hypothetical protein n=1 Tax=Sphaerotilus sp. TaxID=2093942 RepID=UPI002ACE4098|nr:hypothetical protein [Sphaerotilus sp.]MDZ7855812.1 hypothetical protein [Sphaerotilus sp.]